MRHDLHRRPKRLAAAVGMVAAGFIVNVGLQAYAQQVKKNEVAEKEKKEETFTRPKPTRPIRPEIPGANRYQQDKIFLEYADSLYKDQSSLDTVEKQIVKGNVKFRQAGMWMYCDLAYYYPDLNSLDAFGNVKMEQGDTLFVYADKLYYEGNDRMARLKNGPSNPKVKLINRDVTLTTDSLDYSIAMELGWYSKWGTIDDKVNTLTSLYGEYSPGTKNADFYHDVVLVNNQDGFTMLTDTLRYNTDTHIARIESKTEIQSESDTIFTTRGVYNTNIGNAELLSRSTIVHRDSNNNITTLEGDSIIYDKITRISRAYMFGNPAKHPMPMVLTDTAHKTTLIGGFGQYNDSTREAFASIYPMLLEYSQGDTLFLRADTIKTFIVTEMVRASRRLTASGFPEFEGKPVLTAKEGYIVLDDEFFSSTLPLLGAAIAQLNAVAPPQEKNEKKQEEVPMPQRLDPRRELRKGLLEAGIDSVPESSKITELPIDSLGIEEGLVADRDSLPNIEDSETEAPKDSIPLVPREFHVAQAYHRARFFKQDIQGVADSMIFVEKDSMMFMFRKPIVWSGERQVTGNRIDVHFNDSTADWALLPESGLLSELVDEDFYNQLAGKKLLANFADQTLKDLEVSGNVEIIFLPQESDSTYNRMVAAESSYLHLDMKENKIDRLKMWPEVNGTVTPLFMVKKQQQYLRQFRWWESLRPVRERIGVRWRWEDNLGEVSDALDAYLTAPSDFGEPKSFPASRPEPYVPPVKPVTLPDIEKNEEEMAKEDESIEQQSTSIEKTIEEEESSEATSEEAEGASEETEVTTEEETEAVINEEETIENKEENQ
ncbi:MAG: LPS export ABC transporter periplasmic protein LptC [Muribaculaceae bacterium]|nr:LPS export ABC transporter periplasmic protein LptC [Muribaculaceae bacterium]